MRRERKNRFLMGAARKDYKYEPSLIRMDTMIRRKEIVMNMRISVAAILVLAFAGLSRGQEFSIFWWTIDGGGAMRTTGGDLELSGTIGQADAGPATPMTGGGFELTGGFWPGAGAPEEGCTGAEKLKKAKCTDRNGENQLKVSLTGGRPGDTFVVTLSSDGDSKAGTINSRGKGKAKFNNRPPGDSGVASAEWGCGAVDEKEYTCP
ncbi:MAG: hypothetical protein FLDDKLPJ_02657 [Phycisphaerae bacterium]|nr:hypothetical protein [Phycisphaerae bacterium]